MADYIIKASTEKIRTTANQISTQKATMEGIMNEMQSKVTSLKDVFKSDAGNNYITQYTNLSKNIQGSLDELTKVVNNMMEAADIFDSKNSATTNKVNSLSTENIY